MTLSKLKMLCDFLVSSEFMNFKDFFFSENLVRN